MPLNLSSYFLPYQLAWVNDETQMKCGEKARRVGFTYATSFRAVRKCMTRQNFTQWVSSTDDATAKEFIRDYVSKWCGALNVAAGAIEGADGEKIVDLSKDIQARVAYFKATKSAIFSVSSNPAAYAGKGGDVMLDEMDVRKNAQPAFDMASPCVDWGGQIEVFSAYDPDGNTQTFFARLVKEIRDGRRPGWSLHRVTIEDAVEQGLVEKINAVSGKPQTREEFLKKCRAKQSRESAYRAQYLCIPQDEGGAVLPFGLIISAEMPKAALDAVVRANPDAPRYAGYDVARRGHKSAWWEDAHIGDTSYCADLQTFKDMSFDAQESWIARRLIENPNIKRLAIDETGLGMMMAERLHKRFGSRVEPVNFSKCQVDLGMKFFDRFETHKIRIPENEELRVSLNKPRKAETSAGNMRIATDADETGHADEFWAGALAEHAGELKGVSFTPVTFQTRRSRRRQQGWEAA
jgi:phage FluMu gp28-like protein